MQKKDDQTLQINDVLKKKSEEKGFSEEYLQEIYEVEEKYQNQYTRTEAQKRIRQLILQNVPDDIGEIKKINDEMIEKK